MTETLLITCEHGGNAVPREWRALFRGHGRLLRSHRGWDPGALLVARQLAAAAGADLIHATTTRLLVDLNRSPRHRGLFSEITRNCDAQTRRSILERCYYPYRDAVAAAIRRAVRGGGRVLHLSVHSFTPELNGELRNADIGLLYDPARAGEHRFCLGLRTALLEQRSTLRVRRNYPYRGTADGLVTSLRGAFPARAYRGIELELNQAFATRPAGEWRALRRLLIGTIIAQTQHPRRR